MALNRYFGETVYETPPLIRRRTDQTPRVLKAPGQTVFSVAEKNGSFSYLWKGYRTKAGELNQLLGGVGGVHRISLLRLLATSPSVVYYSLALASTGPTRQKSENQKRRRSRTTTRLLNKQNGTSGTAFPTDCPLPRPDFFRIRPASAPPKLRGCPGAQCSS